MCASANCGLQLRRKDSEAGGSLLSYDLVAKAIPHGDGSLELRQEKVFLVEEDITSLYLDQTSGRYKGGKMPPCPPQQSRPRTSLFPHLAGEHSRQGEMELTWQEIMSIAELQGLDIQNENQFDATLYTNMSQMIPACNYGATQSIVEGTMPTYSQNPPVYERHYPDLMSAPCQQWLGVSSLPNIDSTFGQTSYTGMLLSSTVSQASTSAVGLPTIKNVSLTGLLNEPTIEHMSLAEMALNESLAGNPPCKAQEDLESDSGLSLNYSDAESMEMEGMEHGRMRPEYVEMYPVDYPTHHQHYHMLPAIQEMQMNHPYSLQSSEVPQGFVPHPNGNRVPYGKAKQPCRMDMPFSRDERRAIAMKIPFPTEKIINLPVDDFNELLSKYQLTEAQLALVRDIRRRGKNKVAAQNCRKRKLENIVHLEKDLDQLRHKKEQLFKERCEYEKTLCIMKQKLTELYQEVFTVLKDEDGHPYSPDEYSLQQTTDGSVFLVPQNKKP
ncbi:transcription factor NF-E2 45 kDa subunit [Latimeria chalumnae]|uniref:transcription factor NF-E2 45 kDa subunit n=1 Tax=Latimeria chalumnae TaxID=7897 RepID=UPI0003C152F7|nr:PREDICTED: transcription factor NF-E2 45 kDa subunit [Latimeria chalumnae]|eukprot:XP_005995668.1 PREDICTED: transcription factor NF-E2 45 kDa subunit [Latimeria chalumnae]